MNKVKQLLNEVKRLLEQITKKTPSEQDLSFWSEVLSLESEPYVFGDMTVIEDGSKVKCRVLKTSKYIYIKPVNERQSFSDTIGLTIGFKSEEDAERILNTLYDGISMNEVVDLGFFDFA